MVDTIETPVLDAGYDTDFFLWTQQQAARLREAARARINAPVDWENVAAEIESVGGRDRRELRSLARQAYVHLLKLAVSPAFDPRAGWQKELRAAREQIELILEDSPSLRKEFPELVRKDWSRVFRDTREDSAAFSETHASSEELASLEEEGPQIDNLLQADFYPSPPGRKRP